MALFPKRVDIDNASVQELQQLFTASTKDLQSYLFMLDGRNISRITIMQVRALIQNRLAQLGVSVGSWIAAAVPAQYVQGMHDAAKQQQSFGNHTSANVILGLVMKVSDATGQPQPIAITAVPLEGMTVAGSALSAPRVISPEQKMFDLQTQSVEAIMDGMSKSFGTSMTAMARSADQTIGTIQSLDIRRQIAEKAAEGADTTRISKQISDTIKDGGISALTDAGGKQWSPEGYASMLVNTKLVEARNNGMMNGLTAAGKDLVEVSSHGATDVCGDWEGEILSISGNDPTYPSVDDATADGLFHPNCQHSLNAVNPDDFPSEADDSE